MCIDLSFYVTLKDGGTVWRWHRHFNSPSNPLTQHRALLRMRSLFHTLFNAAALFCMETVTSLRYKSIISHLMAWGQLEFIVMEMETPSCTQFISVAARKQKINKNYCWFIFTQLLVFRMHQLPNIAQNLTEHELNRNSSSGIVHGLKSIQARCTTFAHNIEPTRPSKRNMFLPVQLLFPINESYTH